MQSLVDRAPRGFFGGREPIQLGIEARLAGFFLGNIWVAIFG